MTGWKTEAASLWSQLTDFGYDKDNASVMSARIAVLPNSIDKVAEALAAHNGAAIVAQPGYGMMNAHWFDDGGRFERDYPQHEDSRA